MDATATSVVAAAGNVAQKLLFGRLADLRPTPRAIVAEGPQREVYRFLPPAAGYRDAPPVLLVPPLAAPALCFDLRRGCSLAEHLAGSGRRTYLVDYGEIAFADRHLGIEFWVDEVLPASIEAVSRDAGGLPVHLVAWCLGGIFALLTTADAPGLPVASVTAIASPFDVTAVPMVAPLRPLVELTGGRVVTLTYRALGGVPTPLVRRAYQLAGLDKYLTKPIAMLAHLDDREFLAQLEAVDRFTARMQAYPGRTFGQLYHRFFRSNDLADGHLALGERWVSLAGVRVPVLAVAGAGDTIAPLRAVRHLTELLPGAPRVDFEVAPGGHLGVLTGRAARGTTWAHLARFLAAVDGEPVGRAAGRGAERHG